MPLTAAEQTLESIGHRYNTTRARNAAFYLRFATSQNSYVIAIQECLVATTRDLAPMGTHQPWIRRPLVLDKRAFAIEGSLQGVMYLKASMLWSDA